MLITLEELELHRIVVSKTFAADQLDYRGAEFEQRDVLKVDAVAELAGSEVHIRGRLRTRLEANCDRCLRPVEIPIERDFDIYYRPMESITKEEEEIEISSDELEVGFFEGNSIELQDVVTEQVILALPMKVICQPDCKGLCPVCKVNWNIETCKCSRSRADSPFASLV